jgi:coproporphyrinogen III oxidase-like Fe-S oxidoreductase
VTVSGGDGAKLARLARSEARVRPDDALDSSPYQSYLYAYPHKTAYRRIEPAIPLGPLWAGERRDALFLYVHVPFCEQRCGFCNLFTQPVPDGDRVEAYLATLERQAAVVRRALDEGGAFAIARAAIGGGTPTLLDAHELERVLGVMRRTGYARAPMSVETSPETALPDRLAVVVGGGADRISIGVQSFVDDECRAVNRPQRAADVHRALRAIRDAGPAVLNIDLMYGLPGQTEATWRASLEAALAYAPEELYLYPLYVRPLTTLGRKAARAGAAPQAPADAEQDRRRLALYEQGRDLLRAAGYQQVSMRMFRRAPAGGATAAAAAAGVAAGPVYCCQDDGMIGLGVGARSYTRGVHYSSEWAVGARGVREIIDRWIATPDAGFAVADYGFVLDDEEQRRRWLILSLLSAEGVDLAAYRRRFTRDASVDFPELAELTTRRLAASADGALQLTPAGLARADAIGPWLGSAAVRRRMTEYELA